MKLFTSLALVGLAGLQLVAGASITVEQRSIQEMQKRGPLAMAEAPIELRPLKRRLHRRDDLSALDPRDEDSFFYGDPDGMFKKSETTPKSLILTFISR